jgi:conjugal transfer pilus assembly protein TraW
MRSSKLPSVLLLLSSALAFSVLGQSQEDDWFSDLMRQQQAATQELKRSGQLDSFDPNNVKKGLGDYMKDARRLAEQTARTQSQVAKDGNLVFEGADLERYVTKAPTDPSQAVNPEPSSKSQLSAIFVSFSMTPKELRDAFEEADEHGAELYFNGLHPDDHSITDTMARIRQIMTGSKAFPRARFHPKAFIELNVSQVPMLVHAQTGNVAYASGILNFDWLKREMDYTAGVTNLGRQGPTSAVIEENIVSVMKQRMANIDMDKKKRDAVANFWKKQDFVTLPSAEEHKVFYIDPTVQVSSDIVNPRGDVLARAGQRINPLHKAPTKNTYYLFDASREGHTQWAASKVRPPGVDGVQMFMTATIRQHDGWDHLSSVRSTLNREVHLIPQELVDRFHISALPAIVSTDLTRGVLRVEQINIHEESSQ